MRRTFIWLVVAMVYVNPLFSQGLFESMTSEKEDETEQRTKLELNGYARGLVYGGAEDFDYSHVFGEFALRGKLANKKAFLYTDVRLREGLFYNNKELQLQLKEAYAGYRSSGFDLFLGNQIIAWGRTDGFNPTNNITPNDYFFLTYEPDDQKMSNFMLRTKFRPSHSIDIDLIAIPFFAPSNYRYALFFKDNPVVFLPIDAPSLSFSNGSLAARFNAELPQIGFSLSYFQGYNPFCGIDLESFSLSPVEVVQKPKPYFMRTLGADFAIPIQSWIVRGEAAYSMTKDYADHIYIPNPDLYYVFGIEKNVWDATIIAQYVGRYTFDFVELTQPQLTEMTPEAIAQFAGEMVNYELIKYNRMIFNQHEQTNHMLFLSASRSFFYEVLNIELAGTYNFTNKEQMVRARLKWNLSDGVAANLGCSYMLGDDNSLYDKIGKAMNGVFVGLEVGF